MDELSSQTTEVSNSQIFSSSLLEDFKRISSERSLSNFLDGHQIKPHLRGKMIDWMIEVLTSYKCCESTFFLSVMIMDSFFQNANSAQKIDNLHLIGVTSMFMASKYEDVFPMRMQSVFEKIGHGKLPVEIIKAKEIEILEALNFNISSANAYEICQLSILFTSFIDRPKDVIELFSKIMEYILKMISFEYNILRTQSQAMIAGAACVVSFKILQQVVHDFEVNEYMEAIIKVLELDQENLLKCAEDVLFLAKNFDNMYPQFENLKKFHVSLFEEIANFQKKLIN